MVPKINVKEAIQLVKNTQQGREFLDKNPEYDVIIRKIYPPDIRRILEEYPGMFPFKKMKTDEEFNIISISIVGKTIHRQGYPKFRAYFTETDEKKDRISKILRIIVSK
ncbi:MAG: hypothetical protein ACTSWY_03340 [Promethearchaeota archaeon]